MSFSPSTKPKEFCPHLHNLSSTRYLGSNRIPNKKNNAQSPNHMVVVSCLVNATMHTLDVSVRTELDRTA
eukprot:535080-Pyramimonas_sp.AAC.1